MEKDIVTELVEKGKEPTDLLVSYIGTFFRYIYWGWRVLEEVYGYDKAHELYRKFTWGSPECGESFRQLLKQLDYEVKDITTMGKASAAHYAGLGIPLNIVESTKERVVQEAPFCPNPAFGWRPWDRGLDQFVYHHVDGWCGTVDLFKNYFKVAGLDKELDFHMEGALCTGYPCCRWVIEKKKKSS